MNHIFPVHIVLILQVDNTFVNRDKMSTIWQIFTVDIQLERPSLAVRFGFSIKGGKKQHI
jgi:hypothetical protein